MTSSTTETPRLRRSTRLQKLQNDNPEKDDQRKKAISPPPHIRKRKTASPPTATHSKKAKLYSTTAAAAMKSSPTRRKSKADKKEEDPKSLPRTKELYLHSKHSSLQVIGVDEAGRGPLAGPVVAAATSLPLTTSIDGILDSKQIKTEERRSELYQKIIKSEGVKWAVAVVDAKKIDEMNILQGTLLGMRMAVESLIACSDGEEEENKLEWRIVKKAGIQEEGCYVVVGADNKNDNSTKPSKMTYHALIDGNKSPSFNPTLPLSSTPVIKGDGIEYCIAAASILAKVTRDALMQEYNDLYPQYELSRHKGYPTAAHMQKVMELGASPIHRRSFAPLKYMSLGEDGKILEEEDGCGKEKETQRKKKGGDGNGTKKGKGQENKHFKCIKKGKEN